MSAIEIPLTTARQRAWAAAALYVVVTLLLTYPLSVTANRRLPADDPDGHLFMWTLAWDTHALFRHPVTVFDANIFYPHHNTLAYSENLIGSAFFAAPVLWATGNPVLAVNVVSLLSCVLCGLGGYVLGRRVGLRPATAALVGLVFAFSPPRFFRFSQIHLTAVQWIPFMLASLHAYLDRDRPRDLRLAIGFFALQVVTSGHGAVFALVAVSILLAYRAALGEPIELARRLRDVGVAGALLLLPVALFAIPYRTSQLEVGLRRILEPSATPIESFLASPTRLNVFFQSRILGRNLNDAAVAWLFPGFVPLVFAAIAAVAGAIALVRRAGWPSPRPLARGRWWSAPPYRVPVRVLAVTALSWAFLTMSPSVLPAGDGLTVHAFEGGKVVQSGFLEVRAPGRYIFNVLSDGQSRLIIDELLVFERTSHGLPPNAAIAALGSGSHRVLFEESGPAGRFMWAREGTDATYQDIPAWALSQRDPSDGMSAVARAMTVLERIAGWAVMAAAVACFIAWLAAKRPAWQVSLAEDRRRPTGFYALLTIVSVALAIGPPYGLWQFVYWLPAFNFIRGATRFMILGVLGIAVLAGVGFERATVGFGRGRRRLAAALVGVLLIAEFWPVSFEGVPYQLGIPAADQWVARQPKPFTVAEVPVTRSERYQSNYMLHSMAHWQPTVHGYSGILPALHEELYGQLRSFPSVDSVHHLAELGVTFVIVHGSWFTPEERAAVEERLGSFDSSLKLEYSDADSRVYSIRRPASAERPRNEDRNH